MQPNPLSGPEPYPTPQQRGAAPSPAPGPTPNPYSSQLSRSEVRPGPYLAGMAGPAGGWATGRDPLAAPPRFLVVLGAAVAVAVLHLVLVALVVGPPPSAQVLCRTTGSLVGAAVLSALPTWLFVRRRPMPFWVLILCSAPAYILVRALITLGS